MTLSARNGFFIIGISISAIFLVALAFFAQRVIPLLPKLQELAKESIPNANSYAANPYTPFLVMSIAVLYSCVVQVFIFRYFEKTQSCEIHFLCLYVFAFCLEAARLAVPLTSIYSINHTFSASAERLLLSGRVIAVLSMFMASIYAAGLKVRMQGTVLLAVIAVSILIAQKAPVDALAWDAGLRLISSYKTMFRMLEAPFGVISLLGFLIAAKTRGKEFLLVGLGAALMMLGRFLLLDAYIFWTPIVALLLLTLGTYLAIKELHRVYLWV